MSILGVMSQNIMRAQAKQKAFYDAKRRNYTFAANQLCWVKSHTLSNKAEGIAKSLNDLRDGPYIALEVLGNGAYKLRKVLDGKISPRVNISDMTPYTPEFNAQKWKPGQIDGDLTPVHLETDEDGARIIQTRATTRLTQQSSADTQPKPSNMDRQQNILTDPLGKLGLTPRVVLTRLPQVGEERHQEQRRSSRIASRDAVAHLTSFFKRGGCDDLTSLGEKSPRTNSLILYGLRNSRTT